MKNKKSKELKISKRSYKEFISGELVNLCIPSEDAIKLDGWADWFNDHENLKNTSHGIFPNTSSNQKKILKEIKRQLREVDDQKKIVLLLCEKKNNHAFGVISLQSIDLINKSAEIAINIGNPKISGMSTLASLEAMALISEHGFDLLGLERIYAGQAYPSLLGWNKLLEVIGFKAEGISRKSFKRGHRVSDTLNIACSYEDYRLLKEVRGSLWGNLSIIRKVLRHQPKDSFAKKIDTYFTKIEKNHFKYIFKK
jgi:RimJ/RimL family protein N-acetyltransferase